MAREIKFRAWDKRKNKWIEQESLVINNGLMYEDWRDFEDGEPLSNDDAELVEYTGLKDMNGVEVCEGDICEVNAYTYFPYSLDTVKRVYEVDFVRGAFRLLRNNKATSILFEKTQSYEVIGNIYENPEFLKEG